MSDARPNRNPVFNLARGAAIITKPPPFDFENVFLRVFPLRADIHALRLFCDRYLNIAPEFVTVVDDGTQEYARGSINVDDEGILSQRTVLVENGILKSYMHDRISAAHYGVGAQPWGRSVRRVRGYRIAEVAGLKSPSASLTPPALTCPLCWGALDANPAANCPGVRS